MEKYGYFNLKTGKFIFAQKVCKGCKYYNVCGDPDRIEPCNGREEEKEGGNVNG